MYSRKLLLVWFKTKKKEKRDSITLKNQRKREIECGTRERANVR